MAKLSGVSRRTVLQTSAAAGLVGITRGASAAEPIKIGLPVATTGALGSIGVQMRRACEFWAKQVNAKGGLLGRKVELVIEDTAANPATCVRVAQEMVERNGVRILTGIVASNEALAVVPKLAGWNTIFVSGDNGDGSLTAKALVPNFFRPNTSGPMDARSVALWLRDSPLKKFYGLGMDYAWGHNSVDVFAGLVKQAGRDFIGSVFSPTGTKDFSTYIMKIRESGAQAVFLVLAGDDNNAFLEQAKQYRLSDKVQLLTEQVDEMSIRATGDASVGMIGGTRYTSTLTYPANKTFVAAWEAEYKRAPFMFEGDQYQSCVVLQKGIEKAGSIDADKLRKAMEGLEVDSVKGKILMRACDHQGVQPGFVVKVVKKPGVKYPVPEVIATYSPEQTTPPCNQTDYPN